MGGMQVLEWAALYPERVTAIAPIATAPVQSDWAIALSEAGVLELAPARVLPIGLSGTTDGRAAEWLSGRLATLGLAAPLAPTGDVRIRLELGGGSDAPPDTGGSDPLVLTSIEGGHYQNFVDAIRANDSSKLTSEIEEGHLSTTLPLIANVSYRVGRALTFDGAKEQFVGDEEANQLLTREYREPFVVPEKP